MLIDIAVRSHATAGLIVDAHRDGKRFTVKADDLLVAFLSLEKDAIALKAKRQIE